MLVDFPNQVIGPARNLIERCRKHCDCRRSAVARMLFKCGLQSCEPELVRAQGAIERIAAHALDQFSPAHDQAGLWSAQQFVAAERDDVCAILERLLDYRFTVNAELG